MQMSSVLRYLAVPLQTAPLLFIAVFSVLFLVAARAGLLGIWLGLVLLSGFFNYSFMLLDSMVAGDKEPPVLSIEMMNPISGLRSLMLLVIAVGGFYATDAAAYWFGPAFANVLGLAGAAMLPAVIGVQGATGSIVQSLNPVRCWRLVQRLGRDYLAVVGCITLIWLLYSLLLRSSFGSELPFVIRIVLVMYAWLATFALIGGVLLERRADLGLDDVDASEGMEPDNKDEERLRRERKQLIDRVYGEWRGGARGNAWKTITTHVSESADPMTELLWLYGQTAQWPDQRLAGRLAQEYLPRLLAARRNGEALDILRQRIKAQPDFKPTTASDLITLVKLARDAGDRPTARALLRDFQHTYPGDTLQPEAELLAQQLAR